MPVTATSSGRPVCAIVPALPGADDGRATATLDDQLAAVLAAVDAADAPVVVGHSAASTLAWLAADRRPVAVARVVMIGGWPSSDGSAYNYDNIEISSRQKAVTAESKVSIT